MQTRSGALTSSSSSKSSTTSGVPARTHGRPPSTLRHRGRVGLDLEHYAVAPLREPPTTLLMIGRLLREKGVFEYVAAARKIEATQPRARFQLLGDVDANPRR